MLEVMDFRVERNGVAVCENVALRLVAGSQLGVVGPNGSGKTSLLAGLRGLLPTSGHHHIAGAPASHLSRRKMARHIAVVPQGGDFAFPYTVEEMVLFGRAPHRRPWQAYSESDRQVVRRLLERFGLAALAGVRVDAISGGECRKVFLARAIAQDAPILFLDEPFVGLDPAACEELVDILRSLCREDGKALVTVLHDVGMVERLCDQVVGLRAGRPVFCGPPVEVMTPESLERLFGIPWTVAQVSDGERVLRARRS